MHHITLREVTRENWRATLRLTVHPDQQRFIADYTPIAAIALAKAYIRPDGLTWTPYAFYADTQMIGFVVLAYAANSSQHYWMYHFFIDHEHQGKGYGKAALDTFLHAIAHEHPTCQQINLTVHPDNHRAQRLYANAGFRPTGEQRDGELLYRLHISERATP